MTQSDIVMEILCLIAMCFMHVLEDFHLQGLLGQLKQKQVWVDYCRRESFSFTKYKNDYKVCLFWHAFEWTCFMMAPIYILSCFYFCMDTLGIWVPIFIMFCVNIYIHYLVDNAKCNELKINLVVDQLVHAGQIVATWVIYVIMVMI